MGFIVAMLAQSLYFGPTPVDAAIERCEQFLSDVCGDRSLEAAIGSTSPGCMRCAATSTEARELWAAADKLYEALHLSFRRAARSYIPASIETLAGDYDAAERELRWGYETLEQMGEKSSRATIAAFLAEAVYKQGRDDEAERLTEVSEELAAAGRPRAAGARGGASARRSSPGAASSSRPKSSRREVVALAANTDFPDLKASTSLDLAGGARRGRQRRTKRSSSSIGREQLYERKGNVVAAQQSGLRSAHPTRSGGEHG